MQEIEMFDNYENSKLLSVDEFRQKYPDNTFAFDELGKCDFDGIPVCITRNSENKLDVTFTKNTHVLAIGATRSGKTTGYVIPTLKVLLRKKNKPNLVISDPKQEIYKSCASDLGKEGYRTLMIDFTDCKRSDCWNPLLSAYRAYYNYLHVRDNIIKTTVNGKTVYNFSGTLYKSEKALEEAVRDAEEVYYDEAEKLITRVCSIVVTKENEKDPYWEDEAGDLFCAILYGMLEDIETGEITENNFSFATVLKIFDKISVSYGASGCNEGGFFKKRDPEKSKAYQLAEPCILEQANNTRKCIISVLGSKLSKLRDTAIKRVTCTDTFELSELDNGKPTVIFISYKDETSLHYKLISMFLTDLYTELITIARGKGGLLDSPFYFLLDEFGNLPKFADFDKVISACGGRNIWLLLILQSYAQLNNVYGEGIAEIIKDNLNMHIFFGTNNVQTKMKFSEECGRKTIFSPVSALNGKKEFIENYYIETVPLMPVSKLTHITPGDCIITQMNEDPLWAHIERSYNCPEFKTKEAKSSDRASKIRFADPKYAYEPRKPKKQSLSDYFGNFSESEGE